MIITNLIGGLGNQMFQYAVARALAISNQTIFLLDISDFERYKLHNGFELDRVFSCEIKLASEHDTKSILGWQANKIASKLLRCAPLRALNNSRYIVEPHFHYWPGIKSLKPPFYLKGYWQSPLYFSEFASTIRADFRFKQPLFGKNLQLAHKILGANSVSLHIRGGDYVKNPKTNHIHGTCPASYYSRAVDYINNHIDKPHFFVFTDDIAWAQTYLNIKHPHTFVDHNIGTESYNDMRLMSMCRHHIIANSTFSWWGAWLNDSPEKIVIAPKRWFANYPADTSDLYCPGWILL